MIDFNVESLLQWQCSVQYTLHIYGWLPQTCWAPRSRLRNTEVVCSCGGFKEK